MAQMLGYKVVGSELPADDIAEFFGQDYLDEFNAGHVLVNGNGRENKRPQGTPLFLTSLKKTGLVYGKKESRVGSSIDLERVTECSGSTEDCVEDNDCNAANYLNYLLRSLPKQERRVIRLHFFKNRSWDNISQKMGVPIQEVRRYAISAMKRLRQAAKDMELTIN